MSIILLCHVLLALGSAAPPDSTPRQTAPPRLQGPLLAPLHVAPSRAKTPSCPSASGTFLWDWGGPAPSCSSPLPHRLSKPSRGLTPRSATCACRRGVSSGTAQESLQIQHASAFRPATVVTSRTRVLTCSPVRHQLLVAFLWHVGLQGVGRGGREEGCLGRAGPKANKKSGGIGQIAFSLHPRPAALRLASPLWPTTCAVRVFARLTACTRIGVRVKT